MSIVQIPSVKIDYVRIDHGNATQAQVTSANTETFELTDGQTLIVSINGGSAQTITFYDVDFVNISLATAEEIANIITAQIVNGYSTYETTGEVNIISDVYGAISSVQITGGTANAILAFPTTIAHGANATGAILINRFPEPNEIAYPVDADLQLDVFSASGVAVPLTEIDIYVNNVLAYTGGSFQTGFTGPNSATSSIDAATQHFIIDPNNDLDASSSISMRVMIGYLALDETWVFTTEDIVSPTLSSILATSKKTIQVTFSEAMKAESSTGSDDVLNPNNWTIERNPPENTPAVNVVVTSVAATSSTVYVLTTDIELTFGLEYLLTLENAVDLNDNVISATATDVPFDAFTPNYPTGRKFYLWEMLPQFNRDEDDTGDLARTISIFQEVVNVLLSEIDDFSNILDPDTAPEEFLDAMLQDIGNPFNFIEFEEIDKRRLLQTLVAIYKLKGTEPGIINTIQFLLGITVTLNVFNTGENWILGTASVTQARIVSANSETFALSDGQTLIVRVDDTTNTTVTFNTADFVTIGAATAAEVAAVITDDVTGVVAGAVPDGTVIIQRDAWGDGTAVQILGGTANAALGFSTQAERGEGIYDDVSELGIDTYLAPGTSRQKYTYEIISPVVLTDDQREKIEQIATYMHPAHCHLLRIVEPTSDPETDHLELGISELGGTSGPGTWILH